MSTNADATKKPPQYLNDEQMSDAKLRVQNDQFTRHHEGERKTDDKKHHVSYTCSEGYLTGGIGHRLTDEEAKLYPRGSAIPDDVVKRWEKVDFARAEKYANDLATKHGGVYGDPTVKAVMKDLSFQVGNDGADKFKKMHAALQANDVRTAACELMDSKLSGQTYRRTLERASLLNSLKKN